MAVLLAVALVGAVMPQEIPDAIDARIFRVFDETGKMRAALSADGIWFDDESGTRRASMDTDGIRYTDENGTTRSTVGAFGFDYFDENGKTRAQLGRTVIVTTSTGAETTYPATMVLYDAEFKVIWQAPR